MEVCTMNVKQILGFVVIAAVLWYFLLPWMGIAGLIPSIAVVVGIAALLRSYAKWTWAFPWKISGLMAIVILGIGLFLGGWFSTLGGLGTMGATILPGETIVTPIDVSEVPETSSACVVSGELAGKAATIYINAWDMESNTPYSSAVDLTTNCWVFKNGNGPTNYLRLTNDTADGTINGFAVGDLIYIYCGGTSYYTDPIEGYCVNTEAPTINLETHTIEAESSMQITGYDDTGATALTAGTSGQEDYTITQGANGEDSVYIKLKDNGANNAYDHCAWGTIALTNLTSFKPVASEGYTKVATPTWLQEVALLLNDTNTMSVDYTVYKAETTTRLHEWDSIKQEFIATASSTDPVTSDGASDNAAYYVALSIDCQYARGTDGKIYYDIHDHTDSEGNVGMDETEASPLGKEIGVIIEAR
jgi:hypothetical protein